RWEVWTCDGLPYRDGLLLGRAPNALQLPPGDFELRIRSLEEAPVLSAQSFSVAEEPLVIELAR
ncbi:MAG: hypothetical protein IPJ19_00005, partial [Planctomycetes bacterium]|nr:hypothetical protein [Planctomycetota bacterium]